MGQILSGSIIKHENSLPRDGSTASWKSLNQHQISTQSLGGEYTSEVLEDWLPFCYINSDVN